MAQRILIVEDDTQLANMLAQLLQRLSFEVQVAYNGDDGIECQQAAPADLVVVDIITPGKDGLEVIQTLRSISPTTKIIAVSGGIKQDTSWLSPVAVTLGADLFIKKPFSTMEIATAISGLLDPTLSIAVH